MSTNPVAPEDKDPEDDPSKDFEKLSSEAQPGFFKEFWLFFRSNKKWWLWPILISLLLILVLVLVGNSSLAPFFYPFL